MRGSGPVNLRAFRPDDADAFAVAVRETVGDMERWMPWCHAEYSREEASAWIAQTVACLQSGEKFELAIVDASDRLLGGVGLNQLNGIHRFGNLGYWVRTSAMGHGVAVAAARMHAEFGFGALAMERIEILVDVDNVRSARVAEKLGARLEGRLRRRLRIHDAQRDALLYALIPEDLGPA